jgi:hypothetical protein
VGRELTIIDLAHRNGLHGGYNLWLAIAQRNDSSGRDNVGANNMLTSNGVGAFATGHGENLNGRALLGPPAVVQVVEVAGLALVENRRAPEGNGAVAALGEASGVYGASLRGAVKLELVVGSDVASSALRILDDAVGEGRHENSGSRARWRPLLHVGRCPDQQGS